MQQTSKSQGQQQTGAFIKGLFPVFKVCVKKPPKFLSTLYEVLETEGETQKALQWCMDGKAVQIVNMEFLNTVVIKKYFGLSKPASFMRQLHLYGFRKMFKNCKKTKWDDKVTEIFSQPLFRQGRPELLHQLNKYKKSDFIRGFSRSQNPDLALNKIGDPVNLLLESPLHMSADLESLSKEVKSCIRGQLVQQPAGLDNDQPSQPMPPPTGENKYLQYLKFGRSILARMEEFELEAMTPLQLRFYQTSKEFFEQLDGQVLNVIAGAESVSPAPPLTNQMINPSSNNQQGQKETLPENPSTSYFNLYSLDPPAKKESK